MKYLDLTLRTPELNLACDEALLEACEADPAAEVLRFHECAQPCVIVGHANNRATEVNLAACQALGVPVLRRISGGGAVVLGPGCLAYSITLRIPSRGALANVPETNRFVLERNRAALESLVARPVSVRGHTDLVLAGRKCSGNAQRRKQAALLFHGTFLLEFDVDLMTRLLSHPSREPEYRQGRLHADFMINLGLPAARLKAALREAWVASQPWEVDIDNVLRRLMAERYGQPAWHARA